MIVSSKTVKLAAFVMAGVAHAAFALVLPQDPPVLIEGGAGTPEANAGASFADMSAGTVTSETTAETVEPVAPEPITAEAPPPAAVPPVAPVSPVRPEQSTPVAPELPQAALPAAPVATPAPEPETAMVAEPPPETVTASDPDPDATSVEVSKRPQLRNPDRARQAVRDRTPAPQPKAKPKPKPQATANRGSNTQNATAGAPAGQSQTKSNRQGSRSAHATASGNAAATNYPGVVSRHLSRVRKPSMNRRGASVVSFTVSASGGLGGASIARSSGIAKLDNAALDVIRRAAPFPPPPAGARRNFSIQIEFR